MKTVTMPKLMSELSNLLGELTVPTSGVDGRKIFLQRALEEAWKFYPWPFSNKDQTLQFVNGSAPLPDDFLPEGHYYIDDGYATIDPINYEDRLQTRRIGFYISFDGTNYTANLVNRTDFSGSLRYQYEVPDMTQDDTVTVPYPNPETIALGAIRRTVKSDNPEADASQEIAVFQAALQDDMAPYNAAKKRMRKTRTVMSRAGYSIGEY